MLLKKNKCKCCIFNDLQCHQSSIEFAELFSCHFLKKFEGDF